MRAAKLVATLAFVASILTVGGSQADLRDKVVTRTAGSAPQAAHKIAATPLPPSCPAEALPAPQQVMNAPQQVASTPGQDAAQPSAPAWRSHCASAARGSAPDCSIAQTAFLTQTGQMLASVSVRLPPNSKQPVMMIQVPVGLFLPAGIVIQVDNGQVETLVIQTCDLKGCYAGTGISEELMAALTKGKRFAVTFQNLSRQNVTVPLTLAQFAETYKQIQ